MKLNDCDNCNRKNIKIWRRYNNTAYCGTCYSRVFKRSSCPKCNKLVRLPTFDSKALCRKCEVNKPCTRCGKTNYKTGKITNYGPVCNSCSVYFRDRSNCELCGVTSNRLSKASHLPGDLKVCIKCYNSNKKTCHACKRHRILHTDSTGKLLCKTCLETGIKECAECGFSMPAGYGKRCEECYWSSLLKKRTQLNIAGINSSKISQIFSQFVDWLHQYSGANKAAISINRYALFFFEIDKQFNKAPDYLELINHFGVDGLRCAGLPIKFLNESNLIVIDERIKKEYAEQKRINTLLSRIRDTSETYPIIQAYYQFLLKKVFEGKSSTRSLRLALQPAVSLLLETEKCKQKFPDQKILNDYLTKSPGQKSAITGFINFLKRRYQICLSLDKTDFQKAYKEKRKKIEKELLKLMKEKPINTNQKNQWIKLSLAYFHDLHVKSLTNITIRNSCDGFNVVINTKNILGSKQSLAQNKILRKLLSIADY